MCLTSIRKLYQCILFNDLMVFALRGDTKGKVEIALDLGTVWVHDLGNNDPQTTSDDAIEVCFSASLITLCVHLDVLFSMFLYSLFQYKSGHGRNRELRYICMWNSPKRRVG